MGFMAIRAATNAKVKAEVSLSMCQESAKRAKLFVNIPPTNSMKKNETVMPKAICRRFMLLGG
jgi:hypothetical protein